ncbi:MAG TPA: DUF4304 domain-containing protein [Chitinophagales bacterium]|nr:DUF4304 domain-containing protein [Chitinophagales bacterium]
MQLTSKEIKEKLADDIFKLLKEKGFKRTGMNFSMANGDLIYFIQIQSSQSSTATVCKLTVNVGIVSLKLCELTEINKPNYLNSHWTKRIGFYFDKPADKWWTISDTTSADNAREEIIDLLTKRVLPNIFSFKSTADLKDFWLKGNYAGLTEKQQEYYLKLLEH